MSGFIELPKRKFDQSRECTFSRPFQIRLQCPALGRARKSVQAFRYRSKNLPLFRWRTLETELDWLALGSLELSFCSLRIRLPNLTGMSNFFPFGPEPFQILPFSCGGPFESRMIGGFFRMTVWCGAIMSARGFTWVYIALLGYLRRVFSGFRPGTLRASFRLLASLLKRCLASFRPNTPQSNLNSEVWILVLVVVLVLDQSAFSAAKRARLSRNYFVQLEINAERFVFGGN